MNCLPCCCVAVRCASVNSMPVVRLLQTAGGLLASLVLATHAVAAEQPAIDRLFPAGGQRGSTVTVQLSGKPGDGPVQVWSDRGQLTCQVQEKGDAMSVTIPADAAVGVHWLRFYNASGTTPLKPFVVGALPEVTEQEPNNRLNEALAPEAAAFVANGVLEKTGEVDVYSVAVRQGQTLVAAVQAHRVLGSPMDTVVQILDERGTVLAQNDDDHGNDSLVVRPITQDGRCYVRLFAFPSDPNSSIQFAGAASYVYRLTVTSEAMADYGLPLAVQAGTAGQCEVHGWNIPGGSASMGFVPAAVSATDVTADGGVTAAVRLADRPQVVTVDGPWGLPLPLDVVDHVSVTEAALAAEPRTLVPPFSVSGVIGEPLQRDACEFRGTKNQKLRCRAVARACYSRLDPVLVVLSADGKVLKEADDISKDNADVVVDVTLPADGLYRLEVRDRFAHAGPRYFYRLECAEIAGDPVLSVKEQGFVMPADKPLEIPVTIERRDGFALPLQIEVAGLPEGLVCEPARSEKEGDSAKAVTLKISGTSATGFSGPVQVLAREAAAPTEAAAAASTADAAAEQPAAASGGRRWAATTAVAVPGYVTSSLWLTVPAAAPAEPAAPAAAADSSGN